MNPESTEPPILSRDQLFEEARLKMLDSDFEREYFSQRLDQIRRWSLAWKCGLILAGIVATIGLKVGAGSSYALFWGIVANLVTLLATVFVPALRMERWISSLEREKFSWGELFNDYQELREDVRIGIPTGDAKLRFDAIRSRQRKVAAIKNGVSVNEELRVKAWQLVCDRHGLPVE